MKLSSQLRVILLLFLLVSPRSIFAAEDQSDSLKTTAKIGYISGSGLLALGALIALSANSADEENTYHRQCHGERACSRRHYENDMNDSRILAGTGVLLIGGAIGITIYKHCCELQANASHQYNGFLALQPIVTEGSIENPVWGTMMRFSLRL